MARGSRIVALRSSGISGEVACWSREQRSGNPEQRVTRQRARTLCESRIACASNDGVSVNTQKTARMFWQRAAAHARRAA
jgi:hypothetical protein